MLPRAGGFRNGVHPDDNKRWTAHLALQRLPFGERYILPLGQHIGAPSKALVWRRASRLAFESPVKILRTAEQTRSNCAA